MVLYKHSNSYTNIAPEANFSDSTWLNNQVKLSDYETFTSGGTAEYDGIMTVSIGGYAAGGIKDYWVKINDVLVSRSYVYTAKNANAFGFTTTVHFRKGDVITTNGTIQGVRYYKERDYSYR